MKLWTPLRNEYLALAIEGEGRGVEQQCVQDRLSNHTAKASIGVRTVFTESWSAGNAA